MSEAMSENTVNPIDSERLMSKWPLRAGFFAVAISLILVLLKSWVWVQSGSNGVLSSLVDSTLDILISLSTLGAVWYAMQPADHDHRFGHGKAEGVAALFQSAFIFGSSLFVFLQMGRSFSQGYQITEHTQSIILISIALALNLCLVGFQTYAQRKMPSLAIKADQAHYTGDILIHLGIILSFFCDQYFDWHYFDAILALLVCLWLFYNAYMIGRDSLNMLLDKELAPEQREAISEIIKSDERVLGAHDLRTRQSGRNVLISFDIEADPNLSLKAAHDITVELESRILDLFPHAEIMIHLDPYGDPHDSRHRNLRGLHKI